MNPATAAAPILRAFVEELSRAGVREAVVCPGSRSTPLALALAAHDAIRTTVLLDERSAGFVALGLARTSGRAVVLLGTSGTAVVNFGPAVVEASLSRVPLVVLTADRPVELRDRGAPQTIDQVGLFGRHAKWWTELPLPDDAPETMAHTRSVAGRALAMATAGPAGPVHINAPFREPLVPDGVLGVWPDLAGAPFTRVETGTRQLDAAAIERLADRLVSVDRGLIVAGPMVGRDPAFVDAVVALAASAGYPLITDPLSGLRAGSHDRADVIARADQLVRPGPWIDRHRPDLVLRFGAMPTSKPLVQLLARVEPELLVIDGDGGWREAALVPATFVHADATATARALSAALDARDDVRRPDWRRDWRAAEAAAGRALTGWLGGLDEPFEGAPFATLGAVSGGAVVWAGNSMPVRDLDGWLPSTATALEIHANRGANGIDGVVSTAIGSALAVAADPDDRRSVVLVVGDVSFLHDLGALVTARLTGVSLTVLVISNDGGGIFSFLPQATTADPAVGLPANYERLFGTPHGIEIGPLVEAAGHRHVALTADTVAPALREALGAPGLTVLELRTDRARNVELHRAAAAAVQRALADLLVATEVPT